MVATLLFMGLARTVIFEAVNFSWSHLFSPHCQVFCSCTRSPVFQLTCKRDCKRSRCERFLGNLQLHSIPNIQKDISCVCRCAGAHYASLSLFRALLEIHLGSGIFKGGHGTLSRLPPSSRRRGLGFLGSTPEYPASGLTRSSSALTVECRVEGRKKRETDASLFVRLR